MASLGSPAPRRTNRATSRQAGFSPPPRRVGRVGSKPVSRLATPARGGERMPYIKDDVSVVSGMDVDDQQHAELERGPKPDAVFAKSRELTVAFHAHLPAEVKHILKNADFFRDSYSGDIDHNTGFSLVATSQTCFVWQHTQALTGTPTCYIFSSPLDYSQTAPFHAFVPYSAIREPGLILLSVSGEIRFWDSIGIGLAGGEHYFKTSLGLDAGESATSLTRSDPQTYIASTSQGRLFRLSLTSSGGKYHITSRLFSRLQPSLSLTRFLPSLWSTQPLQPESGNIAAIALGVQSNIGRDVWAIVDTRIQKWHMATEGWEDLLQEDELLPVIKPAILGNLGQTSSTDAYLDIELLDMVVESTGRLDILVSHAPFGEDKEMGHAPRRIYLVLQVTALSDSFEVERLISVPYQSTFGASEAPMHPQIQLMLGGSLISVQFGDAIALCARDNDYKDRIALKSSFDRTLGVGIIEEQAQLLVLTASTMMKATIDFDEVSEFNPETGRSSLIKSIMTQAILCGSYSEVSINPLHFSFPPEVEEESLMSGAEMLSNAVLESDNEVVRVNNDLTSQIATRKERASFLIKFINENGVLGKISQRCRQKLATDAEKLYAAQQLWFRLNEFLSQGHSFSVLNEAVYSYMPQVGEGHHEDFMRAFFRLRVGDLGKLFPYLLDTYKRFRDEDPANAPTFLAESNNVVLTVLTSAFEYREYNRGVYGVELPFLNPWTSRQEVLSTVLDLMTASSSLVETSAFETTGSNSVDEVKSQLPGLATAVFACLNERVEWLKSPPAASEPGSDRELAIVTEKFSELRPGIFDILRVAGFSDHAFDLAEQYHDFRNLASLCNKEKAYPPTQNPHAFRIQSYIERFRDEFSTELFQWYIEHGELRTLYEQEEIYGPYIDRFFATRSHPSVSWIHDLHRHRYAAAADSLLSEGQQAGELVAKQLLFSIGKLSHLAQLQEDSGAEDDSVLDAFHDGLDFVSVHEAVADDLKSVLSTRGKQSLEKQVEVITNAKAAKLVDATALQGVFKQLVRQLLQGKALSVEDIADILSLKDNDADVGDYATALHVLSRANDIPEARKLAAFRSVWRRIYIHDDWEALSQTAGVSDEDLNERFRNTTMFVALSATLVKEYHPEGYILPPSQALLTPNAEKITSRWPGMSPEQVQALEQDYAAERALLERYNLGEAYERAREQVYGEFMGLHSD
ncbi:Non-repetitive/WGA-negative nucleoporin C-terminal-domain-containing protein [Amylostereum chailletii]|nr:Non-repetitive/WGA-negative nucleoporin C-terminal-domain-containing protein [Amylostereum chailletii]